MFCNCPWAWSSHRRSSFTVSSLLFSSPCISCIISPQCTARSRSAAVRLQMQGWYTWLCSAATTGLESKTCVVRDACCLARLVLLVDRTSQRKVQAARTCSRVWLQAEDQEISLLHAAANDKRLQLCCVRSLRQASCHLQLLAAGLLPDSQKQLFTSCVSSLRCFSLQGHYQ